MERWIDRQTDGQTNTRIDEQMEIWKGGQTDRRTDQHTDRWTNGHTDKQKERVYDSPLPSTHEGSLFIS
jgi:hypothetical protein